MRYNEESFTPEEVKKGLHLDFINMLITMNENMTCGVHDIHITTDGYCTIVQWCTKFEEGPQFEFIDSDQEIFTNKQLPDGSNIYVQDEDEYQERLNEYWAENNK